VFPFIPISPFAPSAPVGPGTTTGLAGALTTVGLSQATKLSATSNDGINIEWFIDILLKCEYEQLFCNLSNHNMRLINGCLCDIKHIKILI
jgi:hypothetical protein